ncbi:MAG: leucine-rich repeat domain-containing protein [Clostridia bacterium]|nr:leucine-rich repeat domain-containing protein [Clostridia bacterium]
MKNSKIKLVFLVCIVLCAFTVVSCQRSNGNYMQNGVEYDIYDDHCEVVDIRGIAGFWVEIPSHIEGKPVTSIKVDYRWIFFPDIIQARTLIIPDTVEYIDASVYSECPHLNYNEYEGGLYLGNEENPYYAFMRPKNVTREETVETYSYNPNDMDLPEKETPTLPPYPQYGPNSYSCEIHPDTVVLAEAAFASCEGLKSITIPGRFEILPEYLFAGAQDLESVIIEDGVKVISQGTFENCPSLKTVVLPNNLEEFYSSFAYCSSLEFIELPNCVEYLYDMFYRCSSLKTVYIGKNIKEIDSYAFVECGMLESIEVSEENKYFSSINGNLYSADCTVLIKYAAAKKDEFFEVPDGVTKIDGEAFNGAVNLIEIVVPDSVTEYGHEVFATCTSLETVTLGRGITEIDGKMFGFENPLKTLNVSDTISNIGAGTLSYCDKLEAINVDENNPYYVSINGNLFSKDETVFVRYCAGKADTSFDVPESVVKIGVSAFSNSDNLVTVTMSDNVTSIGSSAFRDCDSLKNVKLCEGVTIISSNMFYGCQSLEEVVLGKKVTSIEKNAFDCTGFNTKVYVPRTVQYIARESYGYADIMYEGTIAEWMKVHERSLEKDERYMQKYDFYFVYCVDGDITIRYDDK